MEEKNIERPEENQSNEKRRKEEKPQLDLVKVSSICKHIFGIETSDIVELESYDDRNFRVKTDVSFHGQSTFTLKVHNGVESDQAEYLDAQNKVLQFLMENGIECPYPIKNTEGKLTSFVELPLKVSKKIKKHAVRLLRWVGGSPMESAEFGLTAITNAGFFLGRMNCVLGGLGSDYGKAFDHPGTHGPRAWDLQCMSSVRQFVRYVDKTRQKVITEVIGEFEKLVVPLLGKTPAETKRGEGLRNLVIQGDFNDANIIMKTENNKATDEVYGVIDFGDMVYSCLVNDVAIGMAYACVSKWGKSRPIEAATAFYSGFTKKLTLEPCEKRVVWTLVACRLAMSHTYGMYSSFKDPENEYLKLHAMPAFTACQTIRSLDRKKLDAML